MWKKISSSTWSPWFSGSILAFIFIISLYMLDGPSGSLTAYEEIIEKGRQIIVEGVIPKLSWEIVFLIGILLGAFVAALASKEFKLQLFPEEHLSKGPTFYLTLGPVYSFLGGLFVMGGLIIAGDTFLKLWIDWLSLYMVTGLFLLIMFVEAVIVGTMLTIKIEEKKDGK